MAEPQNKLDVVADFSYESENPDYNRAYKQWRRTNKAPYMYRYSGNPNEITYVDGNAVPARDAALTERTALTHCATLIGLGLLAYLVCELVGGTLLVGILRLCGAEVGLDFLSLSVRGEQWAVTAVRVSINVMKYLLPAVLLLRLGKLPRRAAVPVRLCGLPETVIAVGAAAGIAGIYTLTAQDAGVNLAQEIFSVPSRTGVMAYGLFDVLAVSALSELLLRGSVLPLLRQFGDSFAIGMTAAAGFLFPNSLPDRISELLIGLASGYLLLRSGSFLKCVLLRAICSALCYARIILIYATGRFPAWQYAMLLLSFGAVLCLFYVRLRKEHIRLKNRDTQLSETRKFITITQCVTVLPWAGLSFLLMLFQVFF